MEPSILSLISVYRHKGIGILYDTHGLHEKTPESLSVLPVCRVDLQLSSLNELVEKGVS